MQFYLPLLSLVTLTLGCQQLSAHSMLPLSLPKNEALFLVMKPVDGGGQITPMIAKLQEGLKANPEDGKTLEKLAQLFIAQARLASDETLYVRSELCGQLLEAQDPNNPTALLLRGHSLLAMHQFHDAEEIATRLIKIRQDMQDYALLGDALMEQGQLEAALPMYQAMIDAKPCMPSYSRIAHIRWLKGDVVGAIEMAEQSISCASYRDPEALLGSPHDSPFFNGRTTSLNWRCSPLRAPRRLSPTTLMRSWCLDVCRWRRASMQKQSCA